MSRVLIGVADRDVAAQVGALAQEVRGFVLVGMAYDTDEVATALGRGELDAVIVHEDLGPLPALELIRQVGSQHPGVGFLLMARDASPDLLRAALRAGARDVLTIPLTVEALAEAVDSAAAWARAVRERMDGENLAQVASNIGGRIVAVAGAKGGVGATTVALHVALAAARHDPDRPVCLVELDLQTGDVRALLEVSSKRSVTDLVAVAAEVTARSLDDTLYVHESGLRVLLCPERGEDGEDVPGPTMRQIMAALKFQYDLVVCDVGAVMTDAATVAVELANEVIVVATPDVPALRAANRLLALWQRLQIRSDGASIVLNRVHREAEIQPEFARRVLNAPVCATTLPSGFRELEAALNTGDPERLEQGGVHRALDALAGELGLVSVPEPRRRLHLRGMRAKAADQTGQVAVETMGVAGIVALMILAVWQIVLVGYSMSIVTNSARSAARGYAVGERDSEVRARAMKALPAPWREDVRVRREPSAIRVTLKVPLLIPGVAGPIEVSDRKRTVVEDEPLPGYYEARTTPDPLPEPEQEPQR